MHASADHQIFLDGKAAEDIASLGHHRQAKPRDILFHDLPSLEARLHALIRRDRRQVGSEVLQVADLVMDPASLRATRAGCELQLSPIALRLLSILMRESPRVVSRQEIEREIWGDELPDSDTLRSHLYNLRKVMDKPFDRPLLHTVQSAGYRLADLAG